MWAWRSVVIGCAGFFAWGCVDNFECGGTNGEPCTDDVGEGTSSAELGAEFCRNIRASSCGTDELEAECLAEREGCEEELHRYLDCAARSSIDCVTFDIYPPEPPEPQVSNSECSELRGTFFECVTGVGPTCGVSFGPGSESVSCGVSCSDFSSTCTGPSQDGPLDCQCTSGPEVHVRFSATDCSRGIIYATGHTCAPP